MSTTGQGGMGWRDGPKGGDRPRGATGLGKRGTSSAAGGGPKEPALIPCPSYKQLEAAALGASESALPGTAPAEALHTFTLDLGASPCFFRDSTTLTPLSAPVLVGLADPSWGPVLARSSIVLPCPAVPSGSLSGLHLSSFSTNLVSTAAHQDVMVTTTTPGGQRVSIGTFASAQVSASGPVAPPLLMSPPVTPDSSVAPPPWSPLLATPSWHALPPPCLWSSQVSASPPALACPALPSLRRGAAACRSSLLLVSPDVCSHANYLHGLRLQLRERFRQDLPVLRLHSDRGGEFSSDLLRDFCFGEGILESFTLPASPQQNGIAYRRIGLVMEVARSSMIHAVAPHFLWPFAIRYAAHQLNLWPRVSLPETSPTMSWTGKVGNMLVFRVWGSRVFVRDRSADKLSARAIPCDITFDESVPFYRLFPYRSVPLPPVPLFLAPGPPPVDPLPPQGRAPSGVSQVDPLLGTVPVEVAVDSGADRGAASGGAEPTRAEPGGAEPGGAERGGAEPEGAEPGGAESEGAESEGAEPGGSLSPRVHPAGESAAGGTGAVGARGAARVGDGGTGVGVGGVTGVAGPGGARAGGTGAGGAGGAAGVGAGGTRGAVVTGAAGPRGARTGGTGAAGAGGAAGVGAGGTRGTGVTGAGGAAGVGAGDTGAGGAGLGVLGVPSSTGLTPPLLCPTPDLSQPPLLPPSLLPAPSSYTEHTGGLTERREPMSRPALPVRAVRTGRTGRCVPHLRPPPVPGTYHMALRPSSFPQRVPLPSPLASSLADGLDHCRLSHCWASHSLDPQVPTPGSAAAAVAAAGPAATELLWAAGPSSWGAAGLTSWGVAGGAASTDGVAGGAAVYGWGNEWVDWLRVGQRVGRRLQVRWWVAGGVAGYGWGSGWGAAGLTSWGVAGGAASTDGVAGGAAVYGWGNEWVDWLRVGQRVGRRLQQVTGGAALTGEAEGDPDAPDIPTPCSYAEAITGPYSSQWQIAMDTEMASWKSTGTYVDAVPPFGANMVDGMWIFRVKRPPGSPPAFKARYVARGFSQRQGVDFFHNFSPTPKMTTLWEIWLRRPPGFTGSFLAGTQWSLRRPVYGLRQAPREWHDTLRTTVAALGFAPSTVDPLLFLLTDTSLPPFYVLVYVDDLVFASADTKALALVKSELQKRHTCIDLGELCSYLGLQITRDRARRTINLTQSHMVQQVLQRFGFLYSPPQSNPLPTGHSLSAPPLDESVEPSGPLRPEHWEAAKRVLRYLCSTSGMGPVLGGRGPVVLTGHAAASWVDNLATQQSSLGYTFSLDSGSVSWRSTCSSSVLSSSCEAEIYAGAMASQELRWLTYLLTDLGERPRSSPVLYVDNKAMIALCQEQRTGAQNEAHHSALIISVSVLF
ncbi:unnamed protein product [Closterium sp. NIES-54]